MRMRMILVDKLLWDTNRVQKVKSFEDGSQKFCLVVQTFTDLQLYSISHNTSTFDESTYI